MNWTELHRCVFDAAMVLWFFRGLRPVVRPTWKKRVMGVALLLCLAPLYVIPGENSVVQLAVRFAVRVAVYVLWITCEKGVGLRRGLYFGLLCWAAFTTQNNIFLTPQLSFLRWNQIAYTPFPWVNLVMNQGLELLFEFLVLTLISRAFPFHDARPIDRRRFFAMAAVVLCELYVKHTLKVMAGALPVAYFKELTVYPILLQVLLTTAMLLWERDLSGRAQRERERLNELAGRYRLESIQIREEATADVRHLHHDLKNHLLSLERLAGDNGKLAEYIQGLLARTARYETLVETGNPMLDGLLSEKIRQARRNEIELSACIDFRPGVFLSDIDVCTIFGNALDNAIEASLKVAEQERRSILVKCGCTAGHLVLTFLNYYAGECKRREGRFLSIKEEPGHGLGLSGIQCAVEKYGGTMSANTDGYQNFILTLLIPLPEQA